VAQTTYTHMNKYKKKIKEINLAITVKKKRERERLCFLPGTRGSCL
jgi:hypothetical protein